MPSCIIKYLPYIALACSCLHSHAQQAADCLEPCFLAGLKYHLKSVNIGMKDGVEPLYQNESFT